LLLLAPRTKLNWSGICRFTPKPMASKKKYLYTAPRYWYHISSTLHRKTEYLIPRDDSHSLNRTSREPPGKRTCVAPSVEHCLTALPYVPGDTFIIYRTHQKCRALKPNGVFDSNVTCEGWLQEPTIFVKIGTLTLYDIANDHKTSYPRGGFYIIDESASGSSSAYSSEVLRWWKKQHLRERFIKQC
jgi:hypothetical protein